MVVSKKAASKRAPAQSAQVVFHRHNGNDAAAVVVDYNLHAQVPAAQPDVKQEDAAHPTYDMIEAVAVDHPGVGLLQLVLLSNDGDEFYVGCMLDRRVIGVERMDSPPAGPSDLDRSAYFSAPLAPGGLSFDDLSL